MSEDKKTVGNMNGPWALAAKFALASYPLVVSLGIGWGSWVTVNTIAMENFMASYPTLARNERESLSSGLRAERSRDLGQLASVVHNLDKEVVKLQVQIVNTQSEHKRLENRIAELTQLLDRLDERLRKDKAVP